MDLKENHSERSEERSGAKARVSREDSSCADRRWARFLRRPSWLSMLLLALPFVGGCLAVPVLVLLYHWPTVNVPVYYFTVRPAAVWFCMVAPFVLSGIVAVRTRWFLCGCLLWAIGFIATEEVLQTAKLFEGRARATFQETQRSFLNPGRFGKTGDGRVSVPLRIVTWNVMGGRLGSREALEQLAGLEPDIILMQECSGRRIRESLKESDYFREFNVDGSYQTILTRFPVERLRVERLSRFRCYAWRVRVAPDADLICVNVHLAPHRLRTQIIRGWTVKGLRNAIRHTREELEGVRGTVDQFAAEAPVILAGDFNLPPRYADLRWATAGLKDCFAENGFGWGKTVPTKLPALRIDMIFVPSDARVYYARAVPTRYSDHYMTLAEVEIPVNRSGLAEGASAPAVPSEKKDRPVADEESGGS